MSQPRELTVYFSAKNVIGATNDFLKPFSFNIVASFEEDAEQDSEVIVARVTAESMLQISTEPEQSVIDVFESQMFGKVSNEAKVEFLNMYRGVVENLAKLHTETQVKALSLKNVDMTALAAKDKDCDILSGDVEHLTEYIESSDKKRIMLAKTTFMSENNLH
jgi:hypothetical protein